MTKLKQKPVKGTFDAWQWRGFIQSEHDFDSEKVHSEVSHSIEYIMDFEVWAKKHLKGKKITYRGNDLVIKDLDYGDKVLKPGMWIVMIPDEYNTPQMNFMTNEQVKSYYDADRL
jgi:hypothetical protein